MKYLYGDSTPFPLVENFLVTLCSATEACVAILRADELAEAAARQVREAEAKTNVELAQLATLARRLDEIFGAELASAGAAGTPSQLVTSRISEFAVAAVKQARADVLSWKDAAVISSARTAPHPVVFAALGAFLVKRQLPETSWSLKWRAGLNGAPVTTEVYSTTPLGIEGTFDVVVPESHTWSRPVRVGQILDEELTILLTRKRWLRDAGPCPERLDKLFITSVVHTRDRVSMTLQRSGKEPSPGLEIVLRNGPEPTELSVTSIERDGAPTGMPEQLTAADVATVQRLWASIKGAISELFCYRNRMTGAKLGGVAVGELTEPTGVAAAIVESIAPIVREIVARSSNRSELALKQQISDGRREELFISADAVLGQINVLSERYQAMFDAFGLRPAHAPQANGVVRKLPPPPPRPASLKAVND